jgi:hypothetical protein
MNTLTIVIPATNTRQAAVATWLIVGELPHMNTIKPIPCGGGYWVVCHPYTLKSGGILHHLRQQGYFIATSATF